MRTRQSCMEQEGALWQEPWAWRPGENPAGMWPPERIWTSKPAWQRGHRKQKGRNHCCLAHPSPPSRPPWHEELMETLSQCCRAAGMLSHCCSSGHCWALWAPPASWGDVSRGHRGGLQAVRPPSELVSKNAQEQKSPVPCDPWPQARLSLPAPALRSRRAAGWQRSCMERYPSSQLYISASSQCCRIPWAGWHLGTLQPNPCSKPGQL